MSSLTIASPTAPSTTTMLYVEVKYGDGEFKPFYDNGANGHQLDAVMRFLTTGQSFVCVPHVAGGIFEATFRTMHEPNHVMYLKQDGTPVIFRFRSC